MGQCYGACSALVLMDEINPIIKGLGKIGCGTGPWGEGSDARKYVSDIESDYFGRR